MLSTDNVQLELFESRFCSLFILHFFADSCG